MRQVKWFLMRIAKQVSHGHGQKKALGTPIGNHHAQAPSVESEYCLVLIITFFWITVFLGISVPSKGTAMSQILLVTGNLGKSH